MATGRVLMKRLFWCVEGRGYGVLVYWIRLNYTSGTSVTRTTTSQLFRVPSPIPSCMAMLVVVVEAVVLPTAQRTRVKGVLIAPALGCIRFDSKQNQTPTNSYHIFHNVKFM